MKTNRINLGVPEIRYPEVLDPELAELRDLSREELLKTARDFETVARILSDRTLTRQTMAERIQEVIDQMLPAARDVVLRSFRQPGGG